MKRQIHQVTAQNYTAHKFALDFIRAPAILCLSKGLTAIAVLFSLPLTGVFTFGAESRRSGSVGREMMKLNADSANIPCIFHTTLYRFLLPDGTIYQI